MIYYRIIIHAFFYQHSIYQLFASSKVYTWFDMLLMRYSRNFSSMIHHIFNNRDFNAFLIVSDDLWSNVISEYHWWSWSLICDQSCSIEFMSSEFDDQIIMENPCSFVNCLRIFFIFVTIWDRALSCWNTIFMISSTCKISKKSINWSRRMMI